MSFSIGVRMHAFITEDGYAVSSDTRGLGVEIADEGVAG